VLGKGKACSSGLRTGELLQDQMSAKLTPEICINKASSNSRLTAAGSKLRLQIAFHRTVSRLFFFSLPTWDEKTTKLHLLAEKLKVLHLNLGHLVGFFFLCVCVFCSTLCLLFDETTTEQHLRHHLQDWRLRPTPKLLRLKLHWI
jgi:hypothetical protein